MKKDNIKYKKKFGQNFLKSDNIVRKIIKISGVDKTSLVIEVGPGAAIMTKQLAFYAKNVLAYEIDYDLHNELESNLFGCSNVDILFQDFLKSDLLSDVNSYSFKKLLFVSNVPYYITTPIILKLINSRLHFNKIVMMVQKEVALRFSSKPGCRDYGSITVLLNYYFDIKKEFYVCRKEFIPEPNVDSCVISFVEKNNKLYLKDFNFFERLVKDSFQYKRKTIKNNLKAYDLIIIENILNENGFDLNVRAEALSVEIFVMLANALCN